MPKETRYQKVQISKHKIFSFFPKRSKYCVCIPIFAEGKRIEAQLKKMKPLLKLVDVIISDAGSSLGTMDPRVAKQLKCKALLVNLGLNTGQSNSLKIGLSYCLKQGYLGIITVDGNNKDNVSAIPKFIEELDKGFDYIQGSRYLKGGKHKNTPLYREVGSRLIISPVLSLGAGKWYTDTTNAFRAYSKKYLTHKEVLPFRDIFIKYDLLFYLTVRANRLELKTKEIPVERNYPKGMIPTKITGWKVVDLVLTAFKASFGVYNP